MKKLLSTLLLLIPVIVFAQNYPGMNEKDMQKMMERAQEMEACMQKVDQARLEKLEQRASAVDAEIKKLCAAGKRDKAQKKAMTFGTEMANDPAVKEIRKCSEIMQGAMPVMPLMEYDKDRSGHHVCD